MANVLLVDDEEVFVRSLTTGLSDPGNHFNLLAAKNGKKAVEVLESTPVDLVVTDLKMPVMDGFELLAYLSSNFPAIPVIVISAFGTPEVEKQIKTMGVIAMMEKPIDMDRLANAIKEGLEAVSEEGSLRGISLGGFLQLIEMEQKTCLLEVLEEDKKKGVFYFKEGDLYDAACGDSRGVEAALGMLRLNDVKISFKKLPKKKIKRRIETGLMPLILEGSRLKDEAVTKKGDPSGQEGSKVTDDDHLIFEEGPDPNGPRGKTATHEKADQAWKIEEILLTRIKEEKIMANINDKLVQFKDVSGFIGAGTFTPTGEALGIVSENNLNMEQIGILANNTLLNSQKTSLEMGTGKGQLIHIEAEKAHILVRCLNEGDDPLKSKPGKAHFHTVLVLSPEGQVGMGKMRLNQVVESMAEDLR